LSQSPGNTADKAPTADTDRVPFKNKKTKEYRGEEVLSPRPKCRCSPVSRTTPADRRTAATFSCRFGRRASHVERVRSTAET